MKTRPATATLPDWQRPFENDDFRGFFTWDTELTARLGPQFFHACHADEAKTVLEDGRLQLRSHFKVNHPSYGLCAAPGVWCGLNYFHHGNHYGPLIWKFPLRRLDGRTFMVFRRTTERKRYFFVQYEAHIPIFNRAGDPTRRVQPRGFFDSRGEQLSLKTGAIYDLVLTAPVKLAGAALEGVNHSSCISKKCRGASRPEARKMAHGLGVEAVREHLLNDPDLLVWVPEKMGRPFRKVWAPAEALRKPANRQV